MPRHFAETYPSKCPPPYGGTLFNLFSCLPSCPVREAPKRAQWQRPRPPHPPPGQPITRMTHDEPGLAGPDLRPSGEDGDSSPP